MTSDMVSSGRGIMLSKLKREKKKFLSLIRGRKKT